MEENVVPKSVVPRQVPLHEQHLSAGAQMVPFGGYLMPVKFTKIKDEHHAVRTAVGLFDVSHMGQVEIVGSDAAKMINRIITNDVDRLVDGKALYTVMCNPEGGIIDDLVVYRLEEDRYLLCINAANQEKDLAHLLAHQEGDVEVLDRSAETIQLALQGPKAEELLQRITDIDLKEVPFFHCAWGNVAAMTALIARTGYTGEDGFELYLPLEEGKEVYRALLDFSPQELTLCGLGCRDTLRLEAGLALHGQDIDETINPLEAGLGWVVKFDKGVPFIGEGALKEVKREGTKRVKKGFVLEGRGVVRAGYEVEVDGANVGRLTSGSYSPTLDGSIGLGYIDSARKDVETVEVIIRGKAVPARVVKPPFYKR